LVVHFADENNQDFKGLRPFETRNVVIELELPDGVTNAGSHKIFFEMTDLQTSEMVKEKSVFIVPSN
jgi:hypothetical protein